MKTKDKPEKDKKPVPNVVLEVQPVSIRIPVTVKE